MECSGSPTLDPTCLPVLVACEKSVSLYDVGKSLLCGLFKGLYSGFEQQGVCYAFVEFEDTTAAQTAIEVQVYFLAFECLL